MREKGEKEGWKEVTKGKVDGKKTQEGLGRFL